MKLKDVVIGMMVIHGDDEFLVEDKDGRQITISNESYEPFKVAASKVEPAPEGEAPETDDEGEDEPTTMSSHIRKYRPRYTKTKAYSGSTSLNNADEVAKALGGLTPKQVASLAMELIHECPDLGALYGHLNPGQIRMNSGNRIRAAIKRGDLKAEEVTKAAAKMPRPQVINEDKKVAAK